MPSSKQGKKPSDRKPKTARYGASWKTPLTDLELPSGELCQVKRPGIQGLMKAGVLQSMDVLTSIVQTETIPKAEGKPVKSNVESIIDDPDKFNKMMETVDKIVLHVVTQPPLLSNLRPVTDEEGNQIVDENGEKLVEEIPDEEREPDGVYVDYVDTNDKMFIMNFAVGGSADLQQFRKATEAALGGAPAGEEPADSSE